MKRLPCLILVLSSLWYFFSYPEVDPDLWGHLFFGREILQTGSLPEKNLYSYTAPEHPWINHEWLAEVVFYGVFYLLSSSGLILLKLALAAGLVWILDLILRERISSPYARVLVLVWAMAILSPGFNVRPQIFTYFLLAVLLFLCHRAQEKASRMLYGAVPLMILWANLHGGFVAGLGALGLFSIWAVVRGNRGVIIPAALAFASVLLNPYGLRLLSFLAEDLLLHRPITEWQPLSLADLSFWEFKLALVAVVAGSLWGGFWRRWDFILVLLAGWFALRHQRHAPLFAVVAAPFVANGICGVISWIEERVRGGLLACAILLVSLYQFASIGRVHWQHRLQLVVSPFDYPTQAAEFLQRNAIGGNLAVPFDWGEYLIWKLYPQVRVSIDGRYTTAYPMDTIEDNFEWMRGGKNWRRLLDIYPTDVAVTNRYHPVTTLMRKDPEWVYIYSDPVAFVFVRKALRQSPLVEKFRAGKLLPPASPSIYFPG